MQSSHCVASPFETEIGTVPLKAIFCKEWHLLLSKMGGRVLQGDFDEFPFIQSL